MDWSLRKRAAAALDQLSNRFGDEYLDEHRRTTGEVAEASPLLANLMPLLHVSLVSEDWKVKEAGILTLGAVAEGCMTEMEQHLGSVVPANRVPQDPGAGPLHRLLDAVAVRCGSSVAPPCTLRRCSRGCSGALSTATSGCRRRRARAGRL